MIARITEQEARHKQRQDKHGNDMLEVALAVEDTDQDHIHEDGDRQRGDKHLPDDEADQPECNEGSQRQGPDPDDSDGDNASGAV